MKNKLFLIFFVLFLVSYVHAENKGKVTERLIRYGYTLQNQTNRLLDKIEFWTYGPLKETSFRSSGDIKCNYPFELLHDEEGSQILHFRFEKFPPFSVKILDIRASLVLTGDAKALSVSDSKDDLSSEPFIETGAPEIKLLAQKLKAKTPIETARNIHNWVFSNLKYEGYLENPKGALGALKDKKGDCTEFMCLFVALCRANGIPARGIGGYVCRENSFVKPIDFHNWAEFKEGGVWRVSDPQKNKFMSNESDYIAMHLIRDSAQNPLGQWKRYKVSGNGVAVTMNRE